MDTGVVNWGTLRAQGSRAEIDKALTDGRLHKLRRNWYATETANPRVVEAVTAGGVLTCASALALHRVWVPPTDRPHIRGNDATARLHPSWCTQFGRQPAEDQAVDDVETSLRHAAKCLPAEDFIVVCDSVLNHGLLSEEQLGRLFVGAPQFVRQRLARCDARAESGTETMVRLRLCRPNLLIRSQVQIAGVGRVDLMVGRSLIIEVDGYEYRADPETFEKDRLRDLNAKALGYNVIRLTYQQVVFQWPRTLRLLNAILRRGEHLVPLPKNTATTDHP